MCGHMTSPCQLSKIQNGNACHLLQSHTDKLYNTIYYLITFLFSILIIIQSGLCPGLSGAVWYYLWASSSHCPSDCPSGNVVWLENNRNWHRTVTGNIHQFQPNSFFFSYIGVWTQSDQSLSRKPGGVQRPLQKHVCYCNSA